jgi:hypothetical protein
MTPKQWVEEYRILREMREFRSELNELLFPYLCSCLDLEIREWASCLDANADPLLLALKKPPIRESGLFSENGNQNIRDRAIEAEVDRMMSKKGGPIRDIYQENSGESYRFTVEDKQKIREAIAYRILFEQEEIKENIAGINEAIDSITRAHNSGNPIQVHTVDDDGNVIDSDFPGLPEPKPETSTSSLWAIGLSAIAGGLLSSALKPSKDIVRIADEPTTTNEPIAETTKEQKIVE